MHVGQTLCRLSYGSPVSFRVANLASVVSYPSAANVKDTFLTSPTVAFGPDLEVALPLPRLELLWLQSCSWLGLHPLEAVGAASNLLTSLDASAPLPLFPVSRRIPESPRSESWPCPSCE